MRFTTHDIRTSRITQLMLTTNDPREVADYVGHEKVQTSNIYLKKRVGESFGKNAGAPVLFKDKKNREYTQMIIT